jgi:hypothetical protein
LKVLGISPLILHTFGEWVPNNLKGFVQYIEVLLEHFYVFLEVFFDSVL